MHTTASLTSTRTALTSTTLSWANARTAVSTARPKSPLLQRFCKAIQEVKDEAKKNGVPLQLGYTDTESELKPVWYVDVDSPETEVFEIKLTPYGRKIRDLTGPHGVVFDTDVIECY